jgi:hypothetical protein
VVSGFSFQGFYNFWFSGNMAPAARPRPVMIPPTNELRIVLPEPGRATLGVTVGFLILSACLVTNVIVCAHLDRKLAYYAIEKGYTVTIGQSHYEPPAFKPVAIARRSFSGDEVTEDSNFIRLVVSGFRFQGFYNFWFSGNMAAAARPGPVMIPPTNELRIVLPEPGRPTLGVTVGFLILSDPSRLDVHAFAGPHYS